MTESHRIQTTVITWKNRSLAFSDKDGKQLIISFDKLGTAIVSEELATYLEDKYAPNIKNIGNENPKEKNIFSLSEEELRAHFDANYTENDLKSLAAELSLPDYEFKPKKKQSMVTYLVTKIFEKKQSVQETQA